MSSIILPKESPLILEKVGLVTNLGRSLCYYSPALASVYELFLQGLRYPKIQTLKEERTTYPSFSYCQCGCCGKEMLLIRS